MTHPDSHPDADTPVFVFASDSFKGTLSSERVAAIEAEVAAQFYPHAEIRQVIVADGGEGTAHAVCAQAGGAWITTTVHDPLGNSVQAGFCLLPDGRAVIDMASASGLTLVPKSLRNPLTTSTYGTGELIVAALDAHAREIWIGIGGSATVDGGMGMLRALGARFFADEGCNDSQSHHSATGDTCLPGTDNSEDPGHHVHFNGLYRQTGLAGCGADLARVRAIDLSGLDPRLANCPITIMSDVDNPLLGDDGAARIFGPQKGADVAMVEHLESGMSSYARVVERAVGRPIADQPGAGAAGGLGFALMGVLGARMRPGVECVLDLIGFDKLLQGATFCVTGEGRLDAQTLHGKAPLGVAARCRNADVPCAAIVGSIVPDVDPHAFAHFGLFPIVSCIRRSDLAADGAEGLTPLQAEENLREAARCLFMLLVSEHRD